MRYHSNKICPDERTRRMDTWKQWLRRLWIGRWRQRFTVLITYQ